MADDRSETPPVESRDETPDEARSYVESLGLEETFHIGQSLGRILERLENHAKQLDDLKNSIDAMGRDVSRLVREFGFIKKAWWLGLIALGYLLNEAIKFIPTTPP